MINRTISHEAFLELQEYLSLVEAELGRRRISERQIAHLQKIIRLNTPTYSNAPTAKIGKEIIQEMRNAKI
jgi:hypothetical protein|tara:strand:- start:468 stop:680 length:213 start_codon:yes stop_codon:yes gene_type:complete